MPRLTGRIANEGTPLYTVWRGSRAIGASAAAAVMGRDRFQTPEALWLYITRRIEKPPPNAAMLEGLAAEPELTSLYETLRKEEGEPVNLLDAEYDFLRAQIDWLSFEQTRAAEYKLTRSKQAWEMACQDKLAPFWTVSAQHKLMVLGFEELDWFVAKSSETPEAKYDIAAFVVKRDDNYIAKYREKAVRWWETYVVKDINPSDHKLKLIRSA